MFLSISFNFRKPQIISLTFSNRPGGLRCLKYQNVPKLRSFWPIGKPRERFQSSDIRVYFMIFTTFNVSLRAPPCQGGYWPYCQLPHNWSFMWIFWIRIMKALEIYLKETWGWGLPPFCVTRANCLSLPSWDSYQAAKLAASIRPKIQYLEGFANIRLIKCMPR